MAKPFYVAFDLDETLGYFGSPAIHLNYLDLPTYYQENPSRKQPFEPSEDLKGKMKNAFQVFVQCLSSTEEGRRCLRPGILEIVQKISEYQDAGQVKKVIVYSNNGSLILLKFATTMIETILGKPGIFCDHIHFWNPVRREGDAPNYSRPGAASKTWKVFQKIFAQKCGVSNVETEITPENAIFFDDYPHRNLLDTLPPHQYFMVPKYRKDIDYATINICFLKALNETGLDTFPEFYAYAAGIDPFRRIRNATDLVKYINAVNKSYKLKDESFEDITSTILQVIDAIFAPKSASSSSSNLSGPVPAPAPVANGPAPAVNGPAPAANSSEVVSYGENYFPVVDGGYRRKQKRKSLTKKKIAKRRKSYRKANRKI